jgi:hypothetical protein
MAGAIQTSGVFDIQPHELVAFLLRRTGQDAPGAVNAATLLDYLKLDYLSVHFEGNLAPALPSQNRLPRALISFPDRLVAVDSALDPRRARFSVLHEVAHYVLPTHQHALYLCDEDGLSSRTRLDFEIEANRFAADLLFKGRHFLLEASAETPSARTVKALATRYQASFESTARRLVETSLREIMLVVFSPIPDRALLDPSLPAKWEVHYCATSPTFRTRHFAFIRCEAPPEIVAAITTGPRDVADSITAPLPIDGNAGPTTFSAEWFFNHHSIMALLTPAR